MVKNYYISEEGKKAYADIGLDYDMEILEREFEEWYTKKTNDDPLPDGKRPKHIQSMMRLRIPTYPSANEIKYDEYIVHDMLITRMEKVGNCRSRYQSPLGVYPKPEPNYVIVQTADFDRVRKLDGITSVSPVYTIPFTKEKADELFKEYCDRETQFSVQEGNHISSSRRVAVGSFEDWRDGKFSDLFFWGYIPTKTEVEYKDQETKQREKIRVQIESERKQKG